MKYPTIFNVKGLMTPPVNFEVKGADWEILMNSCKSGFWKDDTDTWRPFCTINDADVSEAFVFRCTEAPTEDKCKGCVLLSGNFEQYKLKLKFEKLLEE